MPHLSPIMWTMVYSFSWLTLIMSMISIESINPSILN